MYGRPSTQPIIILNKNMLYNIKKITYNHGRSILGALGFGAFYLTERTIQTGKEMRTYRC